MQSAIVRIGKVFEEAFAVPAVDITQETTPDEVSKWDSLGHMSMISMLEREFGLEFELDEIMEMASVQNILDVLSNKGVAA